MKCKSKKSFRKLNLNFIFYLKSLRKHISTKHVSAAFIFSSQNEGSSRAVYLCTVLMSVLKSVYQVCVPYLTNQCFSLTRFPSKLHGTPNTNSAKLLSRNPHFLLMLVFVTFFPSVSPWKWNKLVVFLHGALFLHCGLGCVWQGGLAQPWPFLLTCRLSGGEHRTLERVRVERWDCGRMDFTRDDMVQHFQDCLSPQLLATSASQLTVGICLHVYVDLRGRLLIFLLYGRSRLEKMTVCLKMDDCLAGGKQDLNIYIAMTE